MFRFARMLALLSFLFSLSAQSQEYRDSMTWLAPTGPRLQKNALPSLADGMRQVLSGNKMMSNLIDLHKARVTRGSPALKPWADSYWPGYLGSINSRYNDPNYPSSTYANENFEYFKNHPKSLYLPNRINQLSPAEKYDLLIGADADGLSKYVFNEGLSQMDEAGDIPAWVGICTGWAAATQAGVPEPYAPVTMTGAHGHKITFYPSDIKALTSWLWAYGERETNSSGSRCNIASPERDENGRVLGNKCFDLNPMAWHLIVSNLIGAQKKNIVFDATFDQEVWNYSVYDYQVSYFNPMTGEDEYKLNDAIVERSAFKNDPYKKYRSSYVKNIVGIKMKLRHLAATEPHDRIHGAPPIEEIEYIYDLELDGAYNIIGGEWYSEDHPDFVWRVAEGQKPFTPSELKFNETNWDFQNREVPEEWLAGAQREAKNGLPLLGIVEGLNKLSQQP